LRVSQSIKLSSAQINTLEDLAQNQRDAALARRASVILECAKGYTNKDVSATVGMNEADVGRWRRVFLENGIDGLKGKNNGGANQYVHFNEDLDKRLDDLLSQTDTDWTLEKLVQALGTTPSIVSAALRRKDINLQRQRQWKIKTQDELLAKNVDVIGLYLTKAEQAMIVCCSTTPIQCLQGEFITRNRALFEDFAAYDGAISVADAINTASLRVHDTSKLPPVSLSTFLDRMLNLYPESECYEYHFIVSSAKTNCYRGVRLENVYQTWTDNPQQWLQLVNQKITELGDRDQVNSVRMLKEALSMYLENCIETTMPIIWTKSLAIKDHMDVSTTAVQQIETLTSEVTSHALEDDLSAVLRKHLDMEELGNNHVKCGFISFVYDNSQISIHVDTGKEKTLDTSTFHIDTVEGWTSAMTVIEQNLLETRNEAGIHAAEMTAEFIKKKII